MSKPMRKKIRFEPEEENLQLKNCRVSICDCKFKMFDEFVKIQVEDQLEVVEVVDHLSLPEVDQQTNQEEEEVLESFPSNTKEQEIVTEIITLIFKLNYGQKENLLNYLHDKMREQEEEKEPEVDQQAIVDGNEKQQQQQQEQLQNEKEPEVHQQVINNDENVDDKVEKVLAMFPIETKQQEEEIEDLISKLNDDQKDQVVKSLKEKIEPYIGDGMTDNQKRRTPNSMMVHLIVTYLYNTFSLYKNGERDFLEIQKLQKMYKYLHNILERVFNGLKDVTNEFYKEQFEPDAEGKPKFRLANKLTNFKKMLIVLQASTKAKKGITLKTTKRKIYEKK